MLYPLLVKQFRLSVKLVFPLISLFVLGYLYNTYGELTKWENWNGFAYTGVLRAVAEVALGASLYHVSRAARKCYDQWIYAETMGGKMLPTLIKAGCYGAVVIYACNGGLLGKNATLHVLLLCAVGVVISFAGIGYSIPDSRLTRWLGKISLPIFIFHGFLRWTCKDLTGNAAVTPKQALVLIAASIAISIGLMYATDFIADRIKPLFAKKHAA